MTLRPPTLHELEAERLTYIDDGEAHAIGQAIADARAAYRAQTDRAANNARAKRRHDLFVASQAKGSSR